MTQRAIQKWEDYEHLISGISKVLETARRASARSVNAIMTAAYWEIGRRIVEFEQAGKPRADYGEELLKRLSRDLTLMRPWFCQEQPLPDAFLLYGLSAHFPDSVWKI